MSRSSLIRCGTMAFSSKATRDRASARRDQRNYIDLDDVGADFFSVMQIPILAVAASTRRTPRPQHQSPSSISPSPASTSPTPTPSASASAWTPKAPTLSGSRSSASSADTHYNTLKTAPPPIHFDLYRQATDIGGVTYIIRSPLAPAQLLPALRNAVKQIDPRPAAHPDPHPAAADRRRHAAGAHVRLTHGGLRHPRSCARLRRNLRHHGLHRLAAYQRDRHPPGPRRSRERIRAMVLRETAWLAAIGVVIGLAATLVPRPAHRVDALRYQTLRPRLPSARPCSSSSGRLHRRLDSPPTVPRRSTPSTLSAANKPLNTKGTL